MRKLLFLLVLGVLFITLPAMAGEAKDITLDCEFRVESRSWSMEWLYDRNWDSLWSGELSGKTIEISSPRPVFGLYLCWAENPRAFMIEQKIGGNWISTDYVPGPFMHQYYPMGGASEIRLKPSGSSRKWFGLSEIFVLGEGKTPGFVQKWAEPDGESDLLVFFAHPDDEALFMGGTIPVYAGEKKMDVIACTISSTSRTRRSELLNSLWTMGMRNYPVFGTFQDKHSTKLTTAYTFFGEANVKRFVVELFRAYKPTVVVTHDLAGEYGHGMHQMCADASIYAFDAAANPEKFPESAAEQGTWQVSKLYLHMYPENPVEMDWDKPLSAFSGRTGFEMAQEGYSKHMSQHRLEQFKVEPRDSARSSYRFGLARSVVGPDVNKDDFLENILSDAFIVTESTTMEGTP
jgi:LmbE family N-acetylglucosaminyl deacetylase